MTNASPLRLPARAFEPSLRPSVRRDDLAGLRPRNRSSHDSFTSPVARVVIQAQHDPANEPSPEPSSSIISLVAREMTSARRAHLILRRDELCRRSASAAFSQRADLRRIIRRLPAKRSCLRRKLRTVTRTTFRASTCSRWLPTGSPLDRSPRSCPRDGPTDPLELRGFPQISSDLHALPAQSPARRSRFSTLRTAFGDPVVFGSIHAAVARAFGLPRNKITDRFPKR